MSQIFAFGLLLAMVTQDLPRIKPASATPNQRIQELHNRHDRRFQADWGTRSSPRSRFR